jgi:hypothetical protein
MSDEPKHHPLAGATGRFPQGKTTPDDQGELSVVCRADKARGLVVLDFGKPVAWLSAPPDQIREIAIQLLRQAAKIDGQTLTITINDRGTMTL